MRAINCKSKEPVLVYACKCLKNGKIYIGSTQNLKRRIYQHKLESKNKHNSNRLYSDAKKYGWENFQWYIIEEEIPCYLRNEREGFWIEFYNSTDVEVGYNNYNVNRRIPELSDNIIYGRP